MSFLFDWSSFSNHESLHLQVKALLSNALNKKKPRILEDSIEVLNLDWGQKPPNIEVLEIGDVAKDRFRGVFKVTYDGSASITLATKVQANLFNVYKTSTLSSFVTPRIVAADATLPIPLHLSLKNIRLQGTVIVVFSKSKGLTLVFRNDPLTSIEVNSSFDELPGVATFLQQQIETQIRGLFREEVPSMLYQLSLKFMPGYKSTPAPKRNRNEYVLIEDIDPERPVSIVNILKIERLQSSPHSLSLNTPPLKNTIMRAQLHDMTMKSRTNSPPPYITLNDHSDVYQMVYLKARQQGQKSAQKKPPKHRVLRLKKSQDNTDSTMNTTEGTLGESNKIGGTSFSFVKGRTNAYKNASTSTPKQQSPQPSQMNLNMNLNFKPGLAHVSHFDLPHSHLMNNWNHANQQAHNNKIDHWYDKLPALEPEYSVDYSDLPPAYPA